MNILPWADPELFVEVKYPSYTMIFYDVVYPKFYSSYENIGEMTTVF